MDKQKIDVLDHGYVRLVSYMQPVPSEPFNVVYQDGQGSAVTRDASWTGDLEIVRNARTSYNADWRTRDEEHPGVAIDKDSKLIKYLYDHQHTSPFEAMVFTFEVQAPIFIFRQWHRHRTWSYNEVSARYTELPDLFYIPKPEHIGHQDPKNKQGRDLANVVKEWAEDKQQFIQSASRLAYQNYQELLRAGVSREIARCVLPVNTYSRMFATVDLHNLFHFLTLRLDEHAQYEIRMYAEALLRLVQPIVPVAVGAFLAAGDWEMDADELYKIPG